MLCRICKNEAKPFMTFGQMPIANAFLSTPTPAHEYFFELAPVFCNVCKTVQIAEQPDPEKMFHDHYAFFSRTSKRMILHFQQFAAWIKETYLSNQNPLVVELGSNDGILLENFVRDGIPNVGIEPSSNVAEVARKHGVNTITEFFSHTLAKKIVEKYGPADVLTSANVMCHIPDLHEVAVGAMTLLKPRGVLIFEDPYLGDVFAKTSYDQLYDEHVYLFSAHSVSNIFERHGFELIDVLPQTTHGGSMRYVLAKKGARPVAPSVPHLLQIEKAQGLDEEKTFAQFKKNCEASKQKLLQTLHEYKSKNLRVVGYAAAAKSTTVFNYCGIGPDLIDYICDTTPLKQNTYAPGSHIPVLSYEKFSAHYPDVAIILAWNHKDEILQKEKKFLEQGGCFLIYVPTIEEIVLNTVMQAT